MASFTILFYRYNSICEEDYIAAFRGLNIEVTEITEEMYDKDIAPSKRVELVHKAIEAHQPLFVFSVNFFPAVADICSIHKVLYLCQTVDAPLPVLYSTSITHPTNRIFLFDRAQYNRFSKYNPENIFHLPLASAIERYDKVTGGITPKDQKKFSGDISFVGSLYAEKDPLYKLKLSEYVQGFINGLIAMQKNIYGVNLLESALNDVCISELKEKLPEYFAFDNAVGETDPYIAAQSVIGMELARQERIETLNALAKEGLKMTLYTRSDTSELKGVQVRGGVETHTEMPKIFRLSKINLNMTIRPIETGLPLRIFDIMGCRGFVLTNYQEEIADLFVPGEEIEFYSDREELIEKCRYYLAHDDIREKIAENGYRKVRENYTYTHRIMTMLRAVLGE